MIQKLENGKTLVTLGEGTVFSGVVRATYDGKEAPIGICFTNHKDGKGTDDIIFQITNVNGVASYLMALVRLVESWDISRDSALSTIIENLKKDLEPHLPQAKTDDIGGNVE